MRSRVPRQFCGDTSAQSTWHSKPLVDLKDAQRVPVNDVNDI